ncbi:hypothetical protein A6V39_05155 [Candidatus Mycoplasma haematobovis]|uniref:Uncharacterized protein n=1 Tax=Candidatus Mycoplasma haematobovis TaxID=432608 RepID=A0A1A9QCX4_9MOLU|nr:hypothetical protein [Candidatus Mycoplasma haematobovis]OAL09816.1 hypothetical protein A6V39_05155 [Candidatus Mycoplasma haematobovis]
MKLPVSLSKLKALFPVFVVGASVAITIKLLTESTPLTSDILSVPAVEDIQKTEYQDDLQEPIEEKEDKPEETPPTPPEPQTEENQEQLPQEDSEKKDEDEPSSEQSDSQQQQQEEKDKQQKDQKEPPKSAPRKFKSDSSNPAIGVLQKLLGLGKNKK